MAFKENVDYVKNELNSEEKFLEGFVKAERFFKKYKFALVGGAIAIVALVSGSLVYSYIQDEEKKEANIAFNKFLDDNSDTKALETLKDKNEKLYNIALYLKEKDNSVSPNVVFLDSLVQYNKALAEENTDSLNTLSMNNQFLLKEFALFNKALIEAKKGNYKDSKETLALIPQTSKVYDLVQLLNHYLITKI